MNFDEFCSRIREIQARGSVDSHRAGDTGVGKTLEDLLGIKENNLAGPDFETYELKSARRGASSMLTLFTKTPEPAGANSLLLGAFGYTKRKAERTSRGQARLDDSTPDEGILAIARAGKELHVTVEYGRENSVGLSLGIRRDTLVVENPKGVPAYYTREYLRSAFEGKYGHKLVYVLADVERPSGGPERFWYNEAHLLSGFGFEGFVRSVRERLVKLDIRIGHFPNGKIHDHGTGFRVFPRDLPKCFAKVTRIL